MPDTISALIIEDSDHDAGVLEKSLSAYEHIASFRLTALGEVDDCITSVYPDVAIVDLYLPDSAGLATLHSLKRKMAAVGNSAPIIVLTDDDDLELASMAISSGAQDWIVKGEANGNVKRAVAVAVARHSACVEASRQLQDYINEKTIMVNGHSVFAAVMTTTGY